MSQIALARVGADLEHIQAATKEAVSCNAAFPTKPQKRLSPPSRRTAPSRSTMSMAAFVEATKPRQFARNPVFRRVGLAVIAVAAIAGAERSPVLGLPNSIGYYCVAAGAVLVAVVTATATLRILMLGMSLDLPPSILLLGPIFVPLATTIDLTPFNSD